MTILGQSIIDIIQSFRRVALNLTTSLNGGEPDSNARGYFTLFDCSTTPGAPLLIYQFGICPVEKVQKYLRLSQEKAHRLQSNNRDISSWQSRDEKIDMYGGAIRLPRGGHIILSFSGLPELVDEALMLCLALELELMTVNEANEIAKISSNAVFFENYLNVVSES